MIQQAIADITAQIREINTANGWRDGRTTFVEHLALLHSEISEALEAYRARGFQDPSRILCERGRRHNPEEDPTHLCKPESVGSEMADTFIRVLDVCDIHGIDLIDEVTRKLAYNRTRGYRHGGKAL